jgi:hypothetical protein
VGIITERLMELELEKDHWWWVACNWYAEGVVGTPGHSRLHHHLGHLSCEAEGKELHHIYHFVKRCLFIFP